MLRLRKTRTRKGVTKEFIELEGKRREVVGKVLLRLKEDQYRDSPLRRVKIKEGEVIEYKPKGAKSKLILMKKDGRLYSLVLKGPF